MANRGLPPAAQGWGQRVDKKLQELDVKASSADTSSTYSIATSEGVMRTLAVTGVARFNTAKSRITEFRSGGDGSKIIHLPLEWDSQGLNALVTVRAAVRAGQNWPSGFNNSLDTGTYLIVGVDSGDGRRNVETEMIVPVVSVGGRPTYFGQVTDTFSVDYETFKNGYAYVRLQAPYGWNQLVDGTIPKSFVELATNTILL